jgi:hypothetical protein
LDQNIFVNQNLKTKDYKVLKKWKVKNDLKNCGLRNRKVIEK